MLAYAESIGLPFVNLDDIPVDEFYAPQMDPNTVRQHSFVPVMADMGKLILASPSPVSLDVEDELRMIFEMPVRSAICTPAQVNAAIGKYYPRDAVQRIASRDSMGTADAASAALSAAAGGASSSKTAAPKEKRVTREKKPLSAEAKKNRLKVTLVAFNFAFMATSFVKYFLPKIPPSLMGVLIPAIGAGLIVGGIAFFLSSREVADADHDAEK